MINTFYGLGALDSASGFLVAMLVGLCFGFSLERAGFGSSRRLAGIFYFRDMAVLKVMFTAVVVAMLGISYALALGLVNADNIYLMPTIYGAQIVGGLIFGVGFVMGGWCPGTAAVGLASGRLDALVFLGGGLLGSILFNELFPVLRSLYSWGDRGVLFVYESLGMSKAAFALLFTLIALVCFWGAEYIEKRRVGGGAHLNSPFIKAFSVALLIFSVGLFVMPPSSGAARTEKTYASTAAGYERMLMEAVETGADHIEPEELADRLISGDPTLLLVDVRTPGEYASFHINGAVNIPISQLGEYLTPYRNAGTIVLYSNGMTHPAQARDSLFREGYQNVYILTDGLKGFMERCLKPVSLRSEPVPASVASRIDIWRNFFSGTPDAKAAEPSEAIAHRAATQDVLVETSWLADNLGREDVRIIDLRSQPEYNSGHIPQSLFLSVESLRGVMGGVSSMLLPVEMLAEHMSLMGIRLTDTLVLVRGNKLHDATLVAAALDRLGHERFAILNGGFAKWAAENRPLDKQLPAVPQSAYPANPLADTFTVDYRTVLGYVQGGGATIIDVRPAEYYTGQKSEEARAGHIPGAVNRPYTEDIENGEAHTSFKSKEQLEGAYAAIVPGRQSTVIVHCRTGHQASQTLYVLRHLLGYEKVHWYDAGWSEWSARLELPIEG